MLPRLLMISFAMFCVGLRAEAQPAPDFSGTWDLDHSRSALEIKAPMSSVFLISHDDPAWRLERTHVYRGRRPDRLVMELTTDGTEHTTVAGRFETKSALGWDGRSLILVWTQHRGEAATANGNVRYSLTEDEQTMIAEEQLERGGKSHRNMWVFTRRPEAN